MDLSVRDWLIIIGALLAVAVLLDGVRRMRNERKDALRMSARTRREGEEKLLNPELPGEARVVAVRETPSLRPSDGGVAEPLPERPEEHEDVLMRGVGEAAAAKASLNASLQHRASPKSERSEASLERAKSAEPRIDKRVADAVDGDVRRAPEPEPEPTSGQAAPAEVEELIVVNVMADSDKPYLGEDLLQILLACDLRYGRMNIFHRFENADGSGPEQFSVANLVEPGNFDLDAIDGFTTPGVVFFMSLPGPKDSMQAFDAMLETARCLVKNLGGELRDQTHSVATKQTLEHYRQRIRDFERRQLTLM